MKTIIIISFLAIFSLNITAMDKSSINISNISIEKREQLVYLSFDVAVGKYSTKEYKMITPAIKTESVSKKFVPVSIESRRAHLISMRNARRNKPPQLKIYRNGDFFTYTDSISYEDWMNGGKLILNYADSICGGIDHSYAETKINPVVFVEEKTTEPESPKSVIRICNSDDDDKVVYFAKGKAGLMDFKPLGNYEFLNEIHDRLTHIISDKRNQLLCIEITGYASPEGRYMENMQLSYDRAQTVKEYLMEYIPELDESLFLLNSMGENWKALQNRIQASDMMYKDEVLEIFANTTLDDEGTARKTALRQLRNGVPYRYMLDHFYPELRNVRKIIITYVSTEDGSRLSSDEGLTEEKKCKAACETCELSG